MSYRNAIDLLTIAAHAASARGISLDEISEILERDYRTSQRVIAALRERFPELDHFRDEESGKTRWRLPNKAIAPLLVPTAEELAALTLAEEMLTNGAGADQVQALRSLHAKILALIPSERSRKIEADEEALLVALGHATRPGPRPVGRETIDLAISTALKGTSRLRIRYRGWKDAISRERIVAPHGLLLGARRYLVAVDLEKVGGGIQHFRVDAIEEAVVLPESFVRRSGFDLDTHAERCFGSYQQEDGIHDVAWRFAAHAASRAEGFLFHPSQIVEHEPGGSLLVRFRASGLLEMCWHLYMWGDAVEVISPPELMSMVNAYRRSDFASMP
ncbi:WYL domain-containing protein [Sphingobium sp. D43FB]|uniref:helix-turn-helix transcriptional regulator n=1 Tax=Sphingobium sp. D43FB TaxID=2017595 RepID=UPI000BB54C44|nr:WYL domain-containing protein [Sphingobium sp. D43FB]PBN43107.1 WYL domain-containing protein [Sphingobium sp. D43FB]